MRTGNRHFAARLVTGTGSGVAYAFAPGRVNNALDLTAAKQGYALLPAGLLANACEATIATWIYPNSNSTWQRIFDFGKDQNSYMFLALTSWATNRFRFAITVAGLANEQVIDSSNSTFTVQSWTHVAVVLGSNGGTLYVNGVRVGGDATVTLRPSDVAAGSNYYIGRSQYSGDPYLDGDIDEFRVYDRALSAAEIQALANGS